MDQEELGWNPEAQEQEISLIDLFWKVVYGWRGIIASTLILAVLACGFGYVKASRANAAAARPESEAGEVTLDEAQEGLTDSQIAALDKAAMLRERLAEQLDYNENAFDMRVDAVEKPSTVIRYYVDTEYTYNYTEENETDPANSIVAAYVAYAAAQGPSLRISSDIPEADYQKLVSASQMSDGRQFAVTLTGLDEGQSRDLAGQISDRLEEYHDSLAKKLGSHKLIEVDRYDQVTRDESLLQKQRDNKDAAIQLQTDLATLTDAFTPEQLTVWEGQTLDEDLPGIEPVQGTELQPLFNVKYVALGALLGLFLACCVIAFRYILNGRLKNLGELGDMYGIRVFGTMTEGRKKKRFLSGIDSWLDRLSGRGRRTLDQQYALALTNLRVTCQKAGVSRLFFTTMAVLDDFDLKMLEKLRGDLSGDGISSSFAEDIVHNAGSLEQMSGAEDIVIVEKAGSTEYDGLRRELTLCAQQGARVLGAVGFE